MEKYIKILLAILVLLPGCTKDFLDINKDPNNPDDAPYYQLLTNIESDMGDGFSIRYGLSNFAAVYMHQITMREDPDQYGINGNSFYTNNQWDVIYTGALEDIELMIKKGDKNGDLIYAGIAKILKAYIFSALVDVYGDVPFSEANKQTEQLTFPKYDEGSAIYPELLALLDEGIANLNDESAVNLLVPGDDDVIYNGDTDKWIRAANTIKLKLYTQLRLVQNVTTEVTALLAGDQLITQESEFILPYGISKNPDNRNPGVLEYESGQKSYYISPWFYRLMKGQNSEIFNGLEDPRIPYYFYNQLGASQATREGNPTEYRDGGFVSIYFGSIGINRDHSTDGSMSVLGLYPVGGRFDEGDHEKVTGESATGAAPYRYLTFADRLYLEAELINVNVIPGGSAAAKQVLEDAMIASFELVDKVVELNGANQVVPLLADDPQVNTYINDVLDEYDLAADANGQLEIIMTQKWISSFGHNVDQWTDYRRTGFPVIFDPRNTTQAPGGEVTSPDGPTLDEAPIPIPVQLINEVPLSLPWGQDDLGLNPNAPTQKNPATFKVFWDN